MMPNDEVYERAARVAVNAVTGDGKNKVFFDSDPAVEALRERFLIIEWTDLPVVREITAAEKAEHKYVTHAVEDQPRGQNIPPNYVNLSAHVLADGHLEDEFRFALGHLALVLKQHELAEEHARSRGPIDKLIEDIAEADPNGAYDVERIAAELAKKYKRIESSDVEI